MSSFITHRKNYANRHLPGDLMPWILVSTVLIILLFSMLRFYTHLTSRNVDLKDKKYVYFYIPGNSDYGTVRRLLIQKEYLRNLNSFDWAARRMKYVHHIRSGKYRIENGMSNRELLLMLRSGRQEPVKIILNNVRNIQDISGKIGHLLEPDSAMFMRLFCDSAFLASYGVDRQTAVTLFIPNTYYFLWNTTAAQFFRRM